MRTPRAWTTLRLSRAGLWFVLAVTVMLAASCERGCEDPEAPPGAKGAQQLAQLVPHDARAVVVSHRLDRLIETLQAGSAELPVASAGFEAPAVWQQVGAMLDRPAVMFRQGGQWTVLAWGDHEREIELQQWPSEAKRTEHSPGTRGASGWREIDDGRLRRWATTDGRRIAVGTVVGDGAEPLDEQIWSSEPGYWSEDPGLQQLGEDEGDSRDFPLYGAVDGRVLLEGLDGEGQAGVVLEQLVAGLGTIYWGVRAGDDSGHWRLDLRVDSRSDVNTPVDGLGEARDPLPDLGGLVRPGAPGVARLSVEPNRLVELLRGSLPPEQRQEFDETIEELEDEQLVDLQADLVDNLTGQAALVIFGIEDIFFELQGLELLAAIVQLEAIRQAVLVPVEDVEQVELVLDAFTQLSQGALRRDAGEHTIQYARFDDGALKWAAILSDEHLTFVDSIVAHDHVRDWERSPRPLQGIFVERGVDSMLEASRGVGVYLDLATIRTILREGGDERRAEWLKPIEALRVQTDIDGQPDRARIDVWLSDRLFEEEE